MEIASVQLSETKLENASEVLRALAHPLRLKILDYIDKFDRINVNRIYNALSLEQSITSQHLRILRLAHLVNTERQGKMIFYTPNYENINKVNQTIKKFLG